MIIRSHFAFARWASREGPRLWIWYVALVFLHGVGPAITPVPLVGCFVERAARQQAAGDDCGWQ